MTIPSSYQTQDLNATLAALLKHYASHSAAEGHGHTAGGIPLRLTVSESLGRTRSDETHFSNPMFSTQVRRTDSVIIYTCMGFIRPFYRYDHAFPPVM